MNDERPIEKLLRRYAKKRRDDAGAPVELHPATRRLLQGEVTRQFPKRTVAGEGEATTFAQVLKLWRGQLIWALPVLIVLAIGVWVLVGPSEKPGPEFDLSGNVSAPAEVVESSFKALETTIRATPASATSLGDQPALAYANRIPARDGRESGGVPAASRETSFGVELDGKALRWNQGDRTTANGWSAILDKAPGRDTADYFAGVSRADELGNQSVVAKQDLAEGAATFSDEKTQSRGVVLSASAKNDSLENSQSARKSYAAAGEGGLVIVPASTPAEFAPAASPKFFRQEARGGGEREKAQAYSQSFANRAPASSYGKIAKPGDIVPVLANFQVEQTGNQLRVIDGDGSTYLGEMELPASGWATLGAFEKKGAGDLNLDRKNKLATDRLGVTQPPEQQNGQNFACRVVGNRTLNQQVIFSWNYVSLTNSLAAAQVKLPPGDRNLLPNNMPAQQLPLLLNNSVINGRAQLGNAKEIEINAVPVPP